MSLKFITEQIDEFELIGLLFVASYAVVSL